jgi:hypothetical protein
MKKTVPAPLFTATVIGRQEEKELLKGIHRSGQAEMVAIMGRRRVGITFLIKNYFRQFAFECTAMHNAGLDEQLENF